MAAFGPPEIGWVRLPDETQADGSGTPQPVLFRDLDGFAVYEGCILIGRTQDVRSATKQVNATPQLLAGQASLGFAIVGPRFRWPASDGAYQLAYNDELLDDARRQAAQAAIQHWQQNTSLRFAPATRTAANVVVFRPGSICASYIGRQDAPQDILLAAGCTPGNVMHEIGHAAGLWHEHTRPDRDQNVKVILSNIQPAARPNFLTRTGDGMALGAYDFASIMHYPADAFAIDPAQPTMASRDGQPIGQRQALSPGDIATIKALYP